MAVEWPFADHIIQLGGVIRGTTEADDGERQQIEADDGERQQHTARSILSDLSTRPGVILADEVGLGKTYVGLAVVASVACATRTSGRPIIVMVPPGLAQKWAREWEQFKTLCCTRPEALSWIRHAYVRTPTEFFRRLNAPRARRPHILWMTTRCFWAGLSDPWIKLALIRLARAQTKLSDSMKGRLFKWATSLVRLKSTGLREGDIAWLLSHPLSKWHNYLLRTGILSAGSEDPIPADLMRHAGELDFGDQRDPKSGELYPGLATLLRDGTIPGKTGAVSSVTENEARSLINQACQAAYWQWIERSSWRSPLLLMDEAHHAKNDKTKLANLFRSEESIRLVEASPNPSKHPLLWEKFDRMLFLTATPFQLGHHELIRVLRSFSAAKWSGPSAPERTRDMFLEGMNELEKRLSENRLSGRRLDRLWGAMAREAVGAYRSNDDDEQAASAWWHAAERGECNQPIDRELLLAVNECRRTKARAESDADDPWRSLRAWVIRHNKSRWLPRAAGGPVVPRRAIYPGHRILEDDADGEQPPTKAVAGLPLAGEVTLPFLLAARAQGELAHGSAKGRAFFAEGLCSSYEAFHHTRESHGDSRDVDDDGAERAGTIAKADWSGSVVPIGWYEDQIEHLIPSKNQQGEARYRHPKIKAVVDRAMKLWLSGEKVLIFCFYRETAKALREHIGREVENATLALAAKRLGLDPSRQTAQLSSWFERIARRLSDEDSPIYKAIIATLREPLDTKQFEVLSSRADELVQLLAAYIRSPSFIARYLPLEIPEVRVALSEGAARASIVREGAKALAGALTGNADASAMTMQNRVHEFLLFVKELHTRRQQQVACEDDAPSDQLADYLRAIAVQTRGEDDEAAGDSSTFRVQQPVRMVYGETKRETRERLMLAFNSPMFPEILISSAVLSEGVDLHRFCRYIIHHDLCWNPSTLEQRTGRVDRIRCKAELTRRPIVIYEPFLAGSADEKMFRVVQDRERWFQIVMGQNFQLDEATSEAFANRIPLPDELARKLVFDLRRHEPGVYHFSTGARATASNEHVAAI
ncbi:helicase-related protein [Bradyrhizobium sp. HKCCYLS3013]|uniref:helicase-related protein n=1 Tax=Bradyrhizobium sp. HKCCYLS3013 TaxID=3420735 RepID=UPI003EBD8C36